MSSKNRQFVGLVHFPWFSYIYILYNIYIYFFRLTSTLQTQLRLRTSLPNSELSLHWGGSDPTIDQESEPFPAEKTQGIPKIPRWKNMAIFHMAFRHVFVKRCQKISFFLFMLTILRTILRNSSSTPGNTQHLLWTVALLLQG